MAADVEVIEKTESRRRERGEAIFYINTQENESKREQSMPYTTDVDIPSTLEPADLPCAKTVFNIAELQNAQRRKISPSSSPPQLQRTFDKNEKVNGVRTVPQINIHYNNDRERRGDMRSPSLDSSDSSSSLMANAFITERMRSLVSAFSRRAIRIKAQITQPPTPSTELSEGEDDVKTPAFRQRFDSYIPEGPSRSASMQSFVGIKSRKAGLIAFGRAIRKRLRFPVAFEPQSYLYIAWLFITCVCYTYNAWVVPFRTVFSEYQSKENLLYWMLVDYSCDVVYVLDILFFKSRVKFIDNGFWVGDPKEMRKNYVKSKSFKLDVAALIPLDIFYIVFGPVSILRFPRLLKLQTFWDFFNRFDAAFSSPHVVRIIRTVIYMLFLIHLETCFYYGVSKLEGIGTNQWVFQGIGNAYVRCFYFATKTATSIGKNPKPQNELEYLFMTFSWLMGVFVFALLIGQIRDIVVTATRNQNEYRRVMDQSVAYLRQLNLPESLHERVRLWFTYTWESQRNLDEMAPLKYLPRKMQTDLAINVHIQTLSKVQLFQDCDKALLRDLVLKLRPVLFLPGDYVCMKGEVGKEMYIVQTGEVLVMGGEKCDIVLATLGEGSVFGEISLLALSGGNRRNADVRSHGFSNIFVLSKTDLQDTIKDYPEAQEILRNKAKKLIKQNEERERKNKEKDKGGEEENVIIGPKPATPKILNTVLQVVKPDSFTASVIRRSSNKSSVGFDPSEDMAVRKRSFLTEEPLKAQKKFSYEQESKDFVKECIASASTFSEEISLTVPLRSVTNFSKISGSFTSSGAYSEALENTCSDVATRSNQWPYLSIDSVNTCNCHWEESHTNCCDAKPSNASNGCLINSQNPMNNSLLDSHRSGVLHNSAIQNTHVEDVSFMKGFHVDMPTDGDCVSVNGEFSPETSFGSQNSYEILLNELTKVAPFMCPESSSNSLSSISDEVMKFTEDDFKSFSCLE